MIRLFRDFLGSLGVIALILSAILLFFLLSFFVPVDHIVGPR